MLAVAATVLFSAAATASAQTSAPIDLTGPPGRGNCAPCHIRIAEGDVPGLIFAHGNHLAFPCESCHRVTPHENGVTRRPDMPICFACHGVVHASGLLATDKCEDCHPPGTRLRPRSHTKDWAKKPHKEATDRDGVNDCMMCHDAPKDCDACHRQEGVTSEPMPPVYDAIVPEIKDRPEFIVDPGQPTTIGQCVFCHSDIDAMSAAQRKRLIFSHEPHMEQNHQCDTCHPEFGHGPETIRRPEMLPCYRCHGLVHADRGLVATEDCAACHPPGFELKPPDHTKPFEAGEHKARADAEPEYCAMCHKAEFCVECHRGEKPGSVPVIPDDHKRADWRTLHGGRYLQQKGACYSCHTPESCQRCHKTPMPHPADWLKSHGLETGVPKEDCYVCHTDRRYCQDCHHDAVKRDRLIESACVPCHAVMKQQPPTAIKDKAFAEHAVHFRVAKEFGGKKDEPYLCDDCHIGFGRVTADGNTNEKGLPSAAHDLRLCYGCHGALDYRNFIIAPYPGASLCFRCHTDLRI